MAMRLRYLSRLLLVLGTWNYSAVAQDAPARETGRDLRYSFAAVDDATFLNDLQMPGARLQNRLLLEPSFAFRYQPRWNFSSSLVGLAFTNGDTHAQLRVKETYASLSAGDFDLAVGRKIVRWGTGYAFTAAGVLDPLRVATDPGDRLNLNEGRDMVKADWMRGRQAITLAWSSAALSGRQSKMHDTAALRYNVMLRGYDTALIAGDDHGGDPFGGLTFTRVFGKAWELHGEAVWRQQAAVLTGAKYTTSTGITLMGEFYTPPNTAYYRSIAIPPTAGRQHYAFLRAGKTRLRELPRWKEWGLTGSLLENLNDYSCTVLLDVERRFGDRFSSYLHSEVPAGKRASEYGATPYVASVSGGIRFQL